MTTAAKKGFQCERRIINRYVHNQIPNVRNDELLNPSSLRVSTFFLF